MQFKEWLFESTQISRQDFLEILRYVQALKMNYGADNRPGIDISKGDYGHTTTDPQRLIRIWKFAINEIKRIENQYFGKEIDIVVNELIHATKYGKGEVSTYDKQIVPVLKELAKLVSSILVNFNQVGFEHKNTQKLADLLIKYKGQLF